MRDGRRGPRHARDVRTLPAARRRGASDDRRLEGRRSGRPRRRRRGRPGAISEIADEAAEQPGWESIGVSRYRDGAVMARRMIDYRAAAWSTRACATRTRSSSRIAPHMMRVDFGDDRLGGRGLGGRARRARRSPTTAAARGEMARWALGVRGDWGVATLAGAEAELDDALAFGETRAARADPAAAVGPGRGGAPGRRAEPRPSRVPGRARSGREPSASGSCSCRSW